MPHTGISKLQTSTLDFIITAIIQFVVRCLFFLLVPLHTAEAEEKIKKSINKLIEQSRKILPKSTRNPPKTRLGRVPGALGGGLGVILAPWAQQGGSPWFVGRLLVAQRGPFGDPFS